MTTSEQLTDETRGSEATPVGQLTAENRFIEVGADVFAYRRFGDAQAMALPLVMLQHFRGNLDSWDPALIDGLAQDREVIPVDNRGVAGRRCHGGRQKAAWNLRTGAAFPSLQDLPWGLLQARLVRGTPKRAELRK